MKRSQEIINRLSKIFDYQKWWEWYKPYEVLIGIILSQRTYWKNVKTASDQLSRKFPSINDIAIANIDDIKDAIKPAGLYNMKAPKIKNLAAFIVKKYDGNLDTILSMKYEDAMKELTQINGIGAKTADVFLMTLASEPIIPIDVHIFRISKRIGLVNENANYNEVKTILENGIKKKDRIMAHMVLIEFGRAICTAQNPKCLECLINDLCDYYQSIKP